MNDLIRPAMYDAHHDIEPVIEPQAGADRAKYDVVSPVCRSGDTFAKGREMAQMNAVIWSPSARPGPMGQ